MVQNALIIAVNPMPRLYIADLVKALQPRNVSVLTLYKGGPLLSEVAVESCVAAGASVIQYSADSKTDYVRLIPEISRKLRQELERDNLDVFVCQPNHLLTNYPVFNRKLRLRDDYAVNLIPDGIANFYLPDSAPYRANMRLKQIIGRLLGLPFVPYEGTYLGLESARYSSYWYTGNPGLMGDHMKLVAFDVNPPKSAPVIENGLIVIGHPQTGPSFSEEHYLGFLATASRLGFESLHYKPHPAEKDIHYKRYAAMFEMQVLESSLTAELASLQFGAVAGVTSSVLFNLRMLGWHDQVYGVQDLNDLVSLTGRSSKELGPLVNFSKTLGIQELKITNRHHNHAA